MYRGKKKYVSLCRVLVCIKKSLFSINHKPGHFLKHRPPLFSFPLYIYHLTMEFDSITKMRVLRRKQ